MSEKLFILGRQGKAVAAASAASLGSADPFGAGRQIVFQDMAGFSGGHVAFSGEATIPRLPHAEVIVLVSGALVIDGESFASGQALVLPKGFAGTVKAEPGTLWFFNAMTAGDPATESQLIRLDPALARAASPGPAPEVVVGPAPSCHSLNLFTDPSAMRAGVWDVMTPCERTFVNHRVHELMHLIEGEVTLTHRDGTQEVIRAGDTILIPRGAPYAWKSERPVIKYYVVL